MKTTYKNQSYGTTLSTGSDRYTSSLANAMKETRMKLTSELLKSVLRPTAWEKEVMFEEEK